MNTVHSVYSTKSKESSQTLLRTVNKDQKDKVDPNAKPSKPLTITQQCPQYNLNIPEYPEERFITEAREEKKKALEKIQNDYKQQELIRKVCHLVRLGESREIE